MGISDWAWARKCLFCLVAALMAATWHGVAQDAIKGDTVAPYPVVEKGIKLTFSQIDKQYLGRKCTVFFKVGRPTGMFATGPGDPDGMVLHRGDVELVNGELFGFSKHQLHLMWFNYGRSWTILGDDIDYIRVAKE